MIKIPVPMLVAATLREVEDNCKADDLVYECHIEKEYDKDYNKRSYIHLFLSSEDEVLYRLRYGIS